MYKCQICQKVVPPRTKAFRFPVETRPKEYREQRIASNQTKYSYITGHGREIVREVTTCPDCAVNIRKQSG